MTLSEARIETPIGEMLALASDEGLVALEFVGPRRFERLYARLERWFPPHDTERRDHRYLKAARAWLRQYFSAVEPPGEVVPLDLRGAPFELRVWDELMLVPAGSTRTYGEIAVTLGDRNAARAVGLAVGSNPVSLIVPCHRIIGSTGSLTGYGGGLDRKRWLLAHERATAPDSVQPGLRF